jgi:hypothetical protein
MLADERHIMIDGERGDDDLTANGVVVDPGAPGLIVPVFERPDSLDPGKI